MHSVAGNASSEDALKRLEATQVCTATYTAVLDVITKYSTHTVLAPISRLKTAGTHFSFSVKFTMVFFSFVCVYLQQACDNAERSVSKLEERLSAQSLENQALQSQNGDLRSMVKVSSQPWAVGHAADPQHPTVGSVYVWGASVSGSLLKRN